MLLDIYHFKRSKLSENQKVGSITPGSKGGNLCNSRTPVWKDKWLKHFLFFFINIIWIYRILEVNSSLLLTVLLKRIIHILFLVKLFQMYLSFFCFRQLTMKSFRQIIHEFDDLKFEKNLFKVSKTTNENHFYIGDSNLIIRFFIEKLLIFLKSNFIKCCILFVFECYR